VSDRQDEDRCPDCSHPMRLHYPKFGCWDVNQVPGDDSTRCYCIRGAVEPCPCGTGCDSETTEL